MKLAKLFTPGQRTRTVTETVTVTRTVTETVTEPPVATGWHIAEEGDVYVLRNGREKVAQMRLTHNVSFDRYCAAIWCNNHLVLHAGTFEECTDILWSLRNA